MTFVTVSDIFAALSNLQDPSPTQVVLNKVASARWVGWSLAALAR